MPTKDDLLVSFTSGQITRREFVSRTAIGAVASASALLPGATQAQSPVKGGRLVVGLQVALGIDSLDPIRYAHAGNVAAGFTIYDTLVNRGADLKPVPWLAESWEMGGDASDWVFKLRKDVNFHDGKALTAADVIYTCHRHLNEDSQSPARAFMSQIAEVKKQDDHTIRFKLSEPNADFPVILSNPRLHITQHGYENFSTTSPGTGPFKVKTFNAESRYVFERNDNYWGTDGPWVDEIEYVAVDGIASRVNALASGTINVLLELDPAAAESVKSDASLQLIRAKGAAAINLAMLVDRAPTNNPHIRLAIKHAINRDKVVDDGLLGYGSVGNDHLISPADPYYCKDIEHRVYFPDTANFHIKMAASENQPIDVYMSDAPGPGTLAVCKAAQASAAICGIQLNFLSQPADTYRSTIWKQKPLVVSGWNLHSVPDLILAIAFQSADGLNETNFRDPGVSNLLRTARATVDLDARKEMYCEVQSVLHEHGGHATLAFRDLLDAAAINVKGISAHPSGPLGFYQFARTAWIEN